MMENIFLVIDLLARRPFENSKKNECHSSFAILVEISLRLLSLTIRLYIHSRIRQITVILKVRRRMQGQNEYLWLTSHYIGGERDIFYVQF